ncbi:BZ3500_MvSof-1268-A1-R1_Chr2-2g04966 [Microbotryum saponariae]|uniref:BZ3500_MvSof-1268-A1-R1_Chr2-2g04966 protein n=1 Tax=Microbotryum saponariae TaxID=289078 RepID=A0A2X0M027_9BASI|nr:BZ3500_MvSof-1268-A1-R1_Chr2-2g04966 [Microbotryum saponariae]SDA00583.1 BZ3501_MvSof-1269-A2-R1_Chr2-2g04640 [Microbotryum saponariae]
MKVESPRVVFFSRAKSRLRASACDSTRDRIADMLATASLEGLDQDFIDQRILPRVLVCEPAALVYQVFGMEPDRFGRQVQNAQNHSKKVKIIRASYDTDCGRQSCLQTVDWASQAAHLGQATGNQAHNLFIAEVQRPPRTANLGGRGRGLTASEHSLTHTQESKYFLSCHQSKLSTADPGLGSRMLVPIAFTGPDFEEQYATSHFPVHPLVDVVMDLAQHALTQPTRLFAPGLAVVDGDAYLVVLDHELCRVAEIADCWGAGFGVFAAVLSTLFGLDIYSSGVSPLFRYECCRETGLTPVSFYTRFLCEGEDEGASGVKGRTTEFEKDKPIRLLVSHVAQGGKSSIFGRCTLIFHLTRPGLVQQSLSGPTPMSSFVLKIQLVPSDYRGNEAHVLESIRLHHARGDLATETVGHLALPELTQSLPPHCSQTPDDELPQLMHPEYPDVPLKDSLRRTLDLLLLRNPTAELPRPLLAVLSDLHASGIHHRDLSLGNILHHDGHLVLIDWDVGAVGASVPVAALEGGLLSMSLATAPLGAIMWHCSGGGSRSTGLYGLHHALGSSMYWFVTVLRYHVATSDSVEVWDDMWFPPPQPIMFSMEMRVDMSL